MSSREKTFSASRRRRKEINYSFSDESRSICQINRQLWRSASLDPRCAPPVVWHSALAIAAPLTRGLPFSFLRLEILPHSDLTLELGLGFSTMNSSFSGDVSFYSLASDGFAVLDTFGWTIQSRHTCPFSGICPGFTSDLPFRQSLMLYLESFGFFQGDFIIRFECFVVCGTPYGFRFSHFVKTIGFGREGVI